MYKFYIDHGYEDLSIVQIELPKKSIDEAKTIEELLMASFEANGKAIRRGRSFFVDTHMDSFRCLFVITSGG